MLAEVGAGRTNDEIGRRLQMSGATARTHVSRVMTKLGARDRSQLVVIAYESGLLTPGADASRIDAPPELRRSCSDGSNRRLARRYR